MPSHLGGAAEGSAGRPTHVATSTHLMLVGISSAMPTWKCTSKYKRHVKSLSFVGQSAAASYLPSVGSGSGAAIQLRGPHHVSTIPITRSLDAYAGVLSSLGTAHMDPPTVSCRELVRSQRSLILCYPTPAPCSAPDTPPASSFLLVVVPTVMEYPLSLCQLPNARSRAHTDGSSAGSCVEHNRSATAEPSRAARPPGGGAARATAACRHPGSASSWCLSPQAAWR